MSKKLVWVPVLVAVLLPFAAHALGLGEIKLNSALNQPLSADIPVVGASPAELDSLQVKVASAQQFQQAGIPMPAVLGTLQFQIVKQPNGGANIHISSNQPVRQPFLDFLLDATWNNGELLREYTVFVNPPNFESTTQAPAPAPAQVQQPTAPVAVPAPVPVKPAAPMAAPMSPAPVAPPVSAVPATPPAAPSTGGNYGPIHRGETLSEIALKLRPQGVSLNQMMIAIYRANGKVFAHNINVMRAGYVLRLPSMGDIQAVSVAEANSEVRTQVESWRTSRGLMAAHKAPKPAPSMAPATPALQLVAPGSAAQTPENALPGAGKGGAGKTGAAPVTKSETTETTAGKTPESHAPIEMKNGGLAAVQQQAAETNKQPAPAPVAPAPKAEQKPLEKPAGKPVVQPAPAASGSILDTLESPYAIAIILIVIVVVLIGVAIKMRKKGGAAAPSPFKTGKTGKIKSSKKKEPAANWEKKEASGLEDTLTQAAADKKESEAAADQFSGGTQAMLSPVVAADTAADKGAAKLDESDPKAEADFHMAYGLYDQAAETLKKALKQEPGRRDLRMKLLEVYFTAGDRVNFLQAARELHQEVGGKADKDWEAVAIMGRQLAPDEALFKSTGTSTGTSTGVDIALDSAAPGTTSATDLDPLAGAFAGIGGPVTAPPVVAAAPTPAPAAADNALEFNLPDIEPLPLKAAPPTEKPAAAPVVQKPATAPAAMDFDLGGLNMEPATPKKKPVKEEPTVTADFGTDSQVEFDKALKELADFVNTNVPPQEETAKPQPTGLSLDAEPPPSAEAGEETLGLNEVGTKLDLARAYIDMGDSEGARNILEEVLHEGDAQQKQHAQQLMKHLG